MSVRVLWEQQGGLCWYCRERIRSREATVDHVLPKSKGGSSDRRNTVMACNDCNGKKASRSTKRVKTLTRLNVLREKAGLGPMTADEADLE